MSGLLQNTSNLTGNLILKLIWTMFKKKKTKQLGLSWWLSGRESTCQCRRHRFDLWSGRIPHAAEQLSPRATTYWVCALEPVNHNYRPHTLRSWSPHSPEPELHSKESHRNEKPAHCNFRAAPLLAATGEKREQQQRPRTVKNKSNSINKIKKLKHKRVKCMILSACGIWGCFEMV